MIRARATRRHPLAATCALFLVVGAALVGCSSSSGGDASKQPTTTAATASSSGGLADGRLDAVQAADQVTGPITGGDYGIPYLAMPAGWTDTYGYTEEEYFLSGTAAAYEVDGDLTADGRWDATRSTDTAPYTTRILVRRPADAADFNGTVVVEWLNVSAGRESDPDFGFLAKPLLADGYAYVGVSAQKVGVEPGGLGMEIPNVPAAALAPLKEWDPERYGDLSHPGDQYSYDIFSQAARTAVDPGKGSPLGGLDVQHVIAVGESQSSFRLTSYVDAVQPLTGMFDGFLVHSRGTSAANLDADGTQKPPAGVQIRTDNDVPVFQFETETDLDFLQFTQARQDDDDHLVTWELAGAAHVDQSTLDYAVEAGKQWAKGANVDFSTTCGRVNEGPQQPVVQAAFAALADWVVDGTAPPSSPRIETDAKDEIVRDADGIAKGGIRTPAVDAPTTILTGTNPSDQAICILFGSTTPMTQAQLDARYTDHADYVEQVTASAEQAVTDGFLSKGSAGEMIAAADDADVP